MKCRCRKKFEDKKRYSAHKARCKEYQKYISDYRNKILTKEYLTKNIVELKRSCYSLEKEINDLNIKTRNIIARCKELGIKTQTVKEAMNNPLTKLQREKTNLKKYGYKNNFQSPKTKKTLAKKYGKGITNVFQLDSVKEKSKKTMLLKYGVENAVELPIYRRNNGLKSIPHKRIEKILDKYNVKYDSENSKQVSFKRYNRALKKQYNPRPDIIIEEQKVIIEIYGDLYHANPKKYKPNDTIVTWDGSVKAKDIQHRDRIRKNHLTSFGYRVHCFWASDIQKNIHEIEKKICTLLKLQTSEKFTQHKSMS